MIPENTMQHRLRIDEILAEDLIEGRDGAAEVFGNEFWRDAGGESLAGIGEGRGGLKEGLVVALVCYKGLISMTEQMGFHGD